MSEERRKPCLFDQANFLSKLTFWWLNPVFSKNSQSVAEKSGQYDVAYSDRADFLERRLDGQWKEELQQQNSDGGGANLKKAIISTFLLQCIIPGFFLFLAESCRLGQAVLLGFMVGCMSSEVGLTPTKAYLYGVGLCCTLFLHAAAATAFFFFTQRVALRMKVALEALLYRKMVSLSCEAAMHTSPSVLVEQFAANTEVFAEALEHFHYLWIGVLQVLLITCLLYAEVGIAGLICLAAVVLVALLHAILESSASKLRERMQVWTERRWQITRHILAVMVQVKVCCLESTLSQSISSLRSKELGSIRGLAAVQGILWCMLGVTCRLTLLLVVLVATVMHGTVSLKSVFTSLALLDVLMWCLHRFLTPFVRDWRAFDKMLANVQTFLLLDKDRELTKDLFMPQTVKLCNEPFADWMVDIDHMTARWHIIHTGERKRFHKHRARDSVSSTKSLLHESDVEHAFFLRCISLQVKKGELIAVVGSPHSGKTSLLMTLISELPFEIGQISINGRVSFCAQDPWLFSGTVQENILFGEPFDASRYEMVVGACSLTQLLEMLPEGDQTEIGERGLQLSCSHKAKITLARAIYQNADVYLLDNIFSYVDNQTRHDVMNWCVYGMLQSKTCIIVTNSLQYLKAASRVAVLKEGSLFDTGSYEELQFRGMDIREYITDQNQNQRRDRLEAEEENFRVRLALLQAKTGDIKSEEDISSLSDFRLFITFLRGKLFYGLLPLLILLWFGSQALSLAADWTLAKWVNAVPLSNENSSIESTSLVIQSLPDTSYPPLLYRIFVAVATATGLMFALVLMELCVSAGKSCHENMLNTLMRAKLGFFLSSSVDSVLSAFTHHLSFIDTSVPLLSYLTVETLLRVVGLLVMMCVINPWLVIPVVLLLVFMAALQVLGVRTLRGICMLRETAHEPVKSDISETLLGLRTIRAFDRKDHFLESFDSHLNLFTWSRFLALCVHSRLLLICVFIFVLFVSPVIFVSIRLVGTINNGLLALCVTYCVTLLTPLQALLRYTVGLGNNMTSVRQALVMQNEEQEPSWFSDKPPPKDWPNRGSITFSHISLLAFPDGPYLLRDVNIHIQSKEKVGVVGEAESGKYLLEAALLRLGQVQGMLFMDGFDLLKIGLHELREKISVVSKDPTLFPGTLRFNLDFSGSLSDDELMGVLDLVGLKDRVAGIRGGLSVDVGADPSLFSLGQRQLLCLARAIIKKTRLLLFEEATDSIEHRLNDQIQRILRAKFRDCTVLTVAHRLSSVMDCDRILVFQNGEVKQFDTPYNLLKIEEGHFVELVERSGRRSAQQLRGMAELSHQQRASASLMLEHAVFMATEQLHASTEDLTFRPGSLAWSNFAQFSKSQDSLEKAYSDWGSRGDLRDDSLTSRPTKGYQLPRMAPAQKVINKRRMSPSRGKRTGTGHEGKEEYSGGTKEESGGEGPEQVPLIARNLAESEEDGRGTGGSREKERTYRPSNGRNVVRGGSGSNSMQTTPIVDYSSSPRPRVRPPASHNANSSANPRGSVERRILETSIDTPPAPRRNFSPHPSSTTENSKATSRVKGSLEMSSENFPGKGGYPPAKARIVSGEYLPSAKDSKEDTEKIIYC